MKIIQIISTPEIETSEYSSSISTVGEVIYGLSDEGKLYIWGNSRIELATPQKYIDDEDGLEKTQTHEIRTGWKLMKDEINEQKA